MKRLFIFGCLAVAIILANLSFWLVGFRPVVTP